MSVDSILQELYDDPEFARKVAGLSEHPILEELYADPAFVELLDSLPGPSAAKSKRPQQKTNSNIENAINAVLRQYHTAIDDKAKHALRAETIPEQKQRGLIRIVYTESEQNYIVHAVVVGRAQREELEGASLTGQLLLPIREINLFSQMYDTLLGKLGIVYTRNHRTVTGKEPFVSYTLGTIGSAKGEAELKTFELAKYATMRMQEKILASGR
ncbi:hypothetical protein HYU18_00500 [Candidatus Woesearchaeota archaeon]|nr:hypothetical protein [Candidatus Woesearchaeota archaeon]